MLVLAEFCVQQEADGVFARQEWSEAEQACQVCAATGRLQLVEGSSVTPELRHLSSAKLEYLRHLAVETRQQGEQLLVFSLWTATLDLLEPILANEGVSFCRWVPALVYILH